MEIKAVIFDMDGLMLDTEKLLVKYWVKAANALGFPMTRQQALYLRSYSSKFAAPKLKEWFGDDCDYDTLRKLRVTLMSEYTEAHGIEIKRGLFELLDHLKENGIMTAVATATRTDRAKPTLEKLGLYDKFDRVICGNMIENGKPCPDIYLYACRELGLAPKNCMALEDSPNGVRSASDAGCVTVMIPDLTPPEKEQRERVFAVCPSLGDVILLLKKTSGS